MLFLIGGLTDSLSPCALTNLAFFIAVLAFFSFQPRVMRSAALFFILGIFTVTFLMMTWLMVPVRTSAVFYNVCRIVYLFLGPGVFILGTIHLLEWRRSRRTKNFDHFLLPFPQSFRGAVRLRRKLIDSQTLHSKKTDFLFLLVGIVLGFIGSVCPEQTYVTTRMYLLANENQIGMFLLLLLAYCGGFVASMLLVLGLGWRVLRSQKLTGWIRNHAGWVKMVYAAVFWAVGLGLIYTFL